MREPGVAEDELEQRLKLRIGQLEEQVRQLTADKESAEAANQAKNQFIIDMGHELRSPLNSILGYAQLLLREVSLNKKSHQGVEVIHKSGNHLLQMIDDIIDLAKIDAGKLQLRQSDFFLISLIDDINTVIKRKAHKKGVSFTWTSNLPRDLMIKGDRQRLEQVMLNLLDLLVNSNSAGTLHFQIDCPGSVDEKHISLTFNISIEGGSNLDTDSGLIVSPDTGLNVSPDTGLVISRQLVELMGGELDVTGEVDSPKQFRFGLKFPVAGTRAKTTAPPAKSAVQSIRGNIMVVDDLWEIRTVLSSVLYNKGFNVLQAGSGLEALEKAPGFEPDLILLDLVMPGLDGFETLLRFRKLPNPVAARAKVVMVSGHTSDKILKECLENGADDYIIKPINFNKLIEKVCRQLNIQPDTDAEPPPPEKKDVMIAPPQEILEHLFHSIDHYDYGGMLTILDHLEETDRKYTPFAKRIRAFASEFLQQQIIDFLNKYMP